LNIAQFKVEEKAGVGCNNILISSRMYSKLGKIIAQKIIPPTKLEAQPTEPVSLT
jgi:hypothetical protein